MYTRSHFIISSFSLIVILVANWMVSGFVPQPLQAAPNTWSLTGALNINRDSHTATLLLSGKVLVAGGIK